MEYKSIDFVGVWSLIMSALSVLGILALTFGPWAEPSGQTTRMILTFSWFAFWMIGTIARNVSALLQTQADQIAALQRQLAERAAA